MGAKESIYCANCHNKNRESYNATYKLSDEETIVPCFCKRPDRYNCKCTNNFTLLSILELPSCNKCKTPIKMHNIPDLADSDYEEHQDLINGSWCICNYESRFNKIANKIEQRNNVINNFMGYNAHTGYEHYRKEGRVLYSYYGCEECVTKSNVRHHFDKYDEEGFTRWRK